MRQEEFINKTCSSLREYGWDFSSEMEKEVKKALADAWAYGYNEGYKDGQEVEQSRF